MLQCMRQLSALECHFVARALDLGRVINVSSALTKYEQGLTFPSTRRERERERELHDQRTCSPERDLPTLHRLRIRRCSALPGGSLEGFLSLISDFNAVSNVVLLVAPWGGSPSFSSTLCHQYP